MDYKSINIGYLEILTVFLPWLQKPSCRMRKDNALTTSQNIVVSVKLALTQICVSTGLPSPQSLRRMQKPSADSRRYGKAGGLRSLISILPFFHYRLSKCPCSGRVISATASWIPPGDRPGNLKARSRIYSGDVVVRISFPNSQEC